MALDPNINTLEKLKFVEGVDGTSVRVIIDGVATLKGDTGEGVPTGGTTGQVLVKSSDSDFDTEWVTAGIVPVEERQGVEDIPLLQDYVSILFSVPVTKNYAVEFSFECNDASPIFLMGIVRNKTLTGFEIGLNSYVDSLNYKANWKTREV